MNKLNEKQEEIARESLKNQLVIAGAGSGKTRVLTHRIEYLIKNLGIQPFNILAISFTNKAVNELKERLSELLGDFSKKIIISTFHGISYRILRTHTTFAGLNPNFQIIDKEDQLRLIKRVMISLQIDDKIYPPKKALSFIANHKNKAIRANQIEDYGNNEIKTYKNIYLYYQKSADKQSLIDFNEILLKSHELLLKNEKLLDFYTNKFKYILIDEFQDTNDVQYAFLKLLASKNNNNFFAVGDDDQSIYGFRGAKTQNLKLFEKEFFDVKTTYLEQNYRSSSIILDAATSVITNNKSRFNKKLWTQKDRGNPIFLYDALNEIDEARYIVKTIKKLTNKVMPLNNFAVFYRNNAQSRAIEEAFVSANINYKIHGSVKFFERMEIKDALAYLRLGVDPNDNFSFERILNVPSRKIGQKSLEKIKENALAIGGSYFDSAKDLLKSSELSSIVKKNLSTFISLIQEINEKSELISVDKLINLVLVKSNLLEMYSQKDIVEAQNRLLNLQELVSASLQFLDSYNDEIEQNQDIAKTSSVVEFLSSINLDPKNKETDDDAVDLMTIHAAKGLEFKVVFLTGLEDEIFPTNRAKFVPSSLEEERRLFYVGMTRAMQSLYLSHAKTRMLYGKTTYQSPSCFLDEISKEYFYKKPYRQTISYEAKQTPKRLLTQTTAQKKLPYKLGQKVMHFKFGQGRVLSYQEQGERSKIKVNFDNFGEKWLVLTMAKLEKA